MTANLRKRTPDSCCVHYERELVISIHRLYRNHPDLLCKPPESELKIIIAIDSNLLVILYCIIICVYASREGTQEQCI